MQIITNRTLFKLSLSFCLMLIGYACEEKQSPIISTEDMASNELDMMTTTVVDMVVNPEIDQQVEPANLDPDGVEPGDTAVLQLQEMRALNFAAFTTSEACALCHSNHFAATAMRNVANEEIAPYNLWRGSMMSNASRDPFWWAQVASEVALNDPEEQEKIEGECIRCHAPALSETARSEANREGRMQDLKGNTHPSIVGLDGVACTTCHQILPDNLGTHESFSGGYVIGQERKIFGPHENPAPGPMINHVNYTPTHATHVTESKLCATCHTLLHEPKEDQGEWGFPEQTPYLEWRNSIYSNEEDPNNPDAKTCQGCHQPTYDEDGYIRTRIARSPPGGDFRINPREPFGQHTFVGANVVMPQMIKAERDTLNPVGTDEALDMVSEIAIGRLESSASLTIEDLEQSAETLSFTVNVESFVGHKLPTGFPSRRVWLVVKATGANDEVLFYSGRYNLQGRIVDAEGKAIESEWAYGPIEPHYQQITNERQVQVYEAVMGDQANRFTHAITQAKGWLKDNRLLPKGYQNDHPEAGYTKPIGLNDDPDFNAGSDRVQYLITLAEGKQVERLQIKLVYQTLGARFMRSLFQVDVPEVAAFRTMYERADVSPVVMAEIDQSL